MEISEGFDYRMIMALSRRDEETGKQTCKERSLM